MENEEQKNQEQPKESKWKGYKPQKGVTPPWDPFNPEKRKNRLTINERKFLYVLGKTGSLQQAYVAAYKVKDYGDSKMQAAHVGAMANQVLNRLKKKAPELTTAATFADIDVNFIKKGLLDLLNHPEATIHEKTRIYELFGKLSDVQAFSEKQVIETKITEVKQQLYSESDEDFPDAVDHRMDRGELEKKFLKDREGHLGIA